MWAPVFRDDAKWEECLREMESWLGTPFRHFTMVKGRGADCTLFIAAVWKTIGFFDKINMVYYPKDWHIHTQQERVKDGIVEHMMLNAGSGYELIACDNKDYLMRGDLIAFSTTKSPVTNHAAIWVGDWPQTREKDQFFNCIDIGQRGVCRLQYNKWWRQRLTTVLRPMEEI
jgi:cell wall-associated NlpC family hydrolase